MPVSQREIGLMMRAVNQMSPELQQVARDLQQAEKQGTNTSLVMFAVGQALQRVGRGMEELGKNILEPLEAGTKAALDLGTQLSLVRTQTDMTDQQFAAMHEHTLDLTQDFPQAARDVAGGLYEIFSTTDATFQQAQDNVALLSKAATASGATIQEVSDGAITVLNAFGLSVDELNKVLDIQFQMVKIGKGHLQDYSNAMYQIAPSAVAAGQSQLEMASTLAFASRNLGSVRAAAVSVGRALDLITRPEVRKNLVQVLGIDVIDHATGQYKAMSQIIAELSSKLQGMSEPRIKYILAQIFGEGEIRAMRFFQTAIPNQAELADMVSRFGDEAPGALNRAYEIMAQDPGVKWQTFLNDVKGAMMEIGDIIIPVFMKVVDWLKKMVDWWRALDPNVKRVVVAIAGFLGILLVVVGTIISFIGVVFGIISILALATGAFKIAGGIILGVIGVIAALIAVGWLLYKNWDALKDPLKMVWDFVVVVFKAIVQVIAHALNAIVQLVGAVIFAVAQVVRGVMTGMGAVFSVFDKEAGRAAYNAANDVERWANSWIQGLSKVNTVLTNTGKYIDQAGTAVASAFNKGKAVVVDTADAAKKAWGDATKVFEQAGKVDIPPLLTPEEMRKQAEEAAREAEKALNELQERTRRAISETKDQISRDVKTIRDDALRMFTVSASVLMDIMRDTGTTAAESMLGGIAKRIEDAAPDVARMVEQFQKQITSFREDFVSDVVDALDFFPDLKDRYMVGIQELTVTMQLAWGRVYEFQNLMLDLSKKLPPEVLRRMGEMGMLVPENIAVLRGLNLATQHELNIWASEFESTFGMVERLGTDFTQRVFGDLAQTVVSSLVPAVHQWEQSMAPLISRLEQLDTVLDKIGNKLEEMTPAAIGFVLGQLQKGIPLGELAQILINAGVVQMQHGGILTGPTFLGGEAGHEGVIPLNDRGAAFMRRAFGDLGGTTINIENHFEGPTTTEVVDYARRMMYEDMNELARELRAR